MDRRSERPRTSNFSKEEESLLLRIVNQHHFIIENKKTDAVTNKMKVQEWLKISEKFNSQKVGQPRDAATLRRKYENIKKVVKKKIREEKAPINKTGGGPPSIITFNEEENNLIGPQAIGLQSLYDDDTYQNQEQEALIIDDTPTTSMIPCTSSQISDTPSMVPGTSLDSHKDFGPKPPLIKKRKKNHPADKISAWATCKAQIAEDEKVLLREYHEIKIKHLVEEHNMRMRHAEEQHAWLREEHLQRLKNLKEEKKKEV